MHSQPTFDFLWRNGILHQRVLVTEIGAPEPVGDEWMPVKVGDRLVKDPSFKTFEDRNGKEPVAKRQGWDHVIEFDGGTSCNNPKNYGNGYGSFQIDGGQIERVSFGKGHSVNSAEVRTLVAALKKLAESGGTGSVLCRGDSKIALRWIKCPWEPKETGSENFLLAVAELKAAVSRFPKVKGEWRRRTHSVALFGH